MNPLYLVIAIFLVANYSPQKGMASERKTQVEESKKTDIKKLICLDRQKELIKQACEEIFVLIKKKAIEIPEKVWINIISEIEKEEILEELIPIYDKYLSHADVKELLEPSGASESQKAKFIQKKLKINVIWSHKLAMKIQQKLWDKNINFDIYDELDDFDATLPKSV